MKKRAVLLTVLFLMVSPAIPRVQKIIPAEYAARVDLELTGEQAVALREYIDLRFQETQRAIDKAEASMNERLAGMNEFRTTLKDQAAKFITRDELNLIIGKIQANIGELQQVRDIATGKASQTSMMIAIAISLLGLGVSIYKTRSGNSIIDFNPKGRKND